ncbi:MAG: thioesterase [Desulfobacteraceae bacterium]|nr:thioesterase [Desulfobacteraceae bacterium]
MNTLLNSHQKIQLFFFPFAGASFYSYNPLVKALPEHRFDTHTLELPGRGKRIKDPLLSNVSDMADDLFGKIKDQISPPYVFFGHSLGSIVSYEVVLKIVDNGLEPPIHFFASGRGGPQVPSKNKNTEFLDEDAFYEKLKNYGGTPDQVLQEKELMAFFEPVLRADFIAAESYECRHCHKIPVPISVLNGTLDSVKPHEALKWQAITESPITCKEFYGKHFFLFDHTKDIGSIICQTLLNSNHF